jgi:glycosyltransferase involved in cell wall biosynthesis
MKVLMFGWEFPPHIAGGLGTACYGLSRGLMSIPDIDLMFVVPKAYGDEDTGRMRLVSAEDIYLDESNIRNKEFLKRIQYIEVNSKLIPYMSPEEYENRVNFTQRSNSILYSNYKGKLKFQGGYGTKLFEEISNYSLIAGAIAFENHFDVIHAHDWLTYPAGIAAKQISGKPLVIHVHATDFDRSGGNVNPSVFAIEKWGMEVADRIITVSNLTRNIVIEKYGINPNKVKTVYNAVDPFVYSKPTVNKTIDDKIVTFLGRITMQKGPEYFLEAAKKVLSRMDNVRFVMAGSGDMMNRMVTRAAKLKISDKFHFTGFLKGDDVNQMFAMSDLYVMPSVSEPFGISPLEAMLSNVPVIISYQSGVAEILRHAFKVNFWDVDAMADAIYGILNYEALPTMFKKHGKIEVENLKWENSAKAVKQIYDEINKK